MRLVKSGRFAESDPAAALGGLDCSRWEVQDDPELGDAWSSLWWVKSRPIQGGLFLTKGTSYLGVFRGLNHWEDRRFVSDSAAPCTSDHLARNSPAKAHHCAPNFLVFSALAPF